MIAALLYLAAAVVLLLVTLGALAPRILGRVLGPPLGFLGMLLALVIPQAIAADIGLTLVAGYSGAFAERAGLVALAAHLACWLALSAALWRMSHAPAILDGAAVLPDRSPFVRPGTPPPLRLDPPVRSFAPWLTLQLPAMHNVEVTRDIVFRSVDGRNLKLDMYRARSADAHTAQPALVYFHGGAWCTGTRRQSRFMMYELAATGWTVFAVSYRLAPQHPMPAAIEDCKAAIAWVRTHAQTLGVDARQIAVLGGSAGGHLAALLALTPNQSELQPGLEQVDTSVIGAVVLYGVTDLIGPLERAQQPGYSYLLERIVFQKPYRDDPLRYRVASPLCHVHADAPPILLVHGTDDSVVSIGQSRRFAQRLRQAGAARVSLLEMPHVHHAFEIMPSPMARSAVQIIAHFLADLRLGQRQEPELDPGPHSEGATSSSSAQTAAQG